eukprot:scaffold26.g3324.t1
MALVDEWNAEISGAGRSTDNITVGPASENAPLFTVEHRAEGRGHAVAFAVCNETVFVATSRNFLLRHDLSGNTAAVAELELAKSGDVRVRRLFVDPVGCHALVTTQGVGGALDTFHVGPDWKRARLLTKLRGVALTSVAWSPTINPCMISEAVLGTDAGALLELNVVDGGKKERVRQLHQLQEGGGPVAGLALIQLAGRPGSRAMGGGPAATVSTATNTAVEDPTRKLLVLALCGTRLHAFCGGPSLEALFASYSGDAAASPRQPRHMDLPIEIGAAQLQVLCPAKQPDPGWLEGAAAAASSTSAMHPAVAVFEMPQPELFAALSPAGIYFGRLDLNPALADETDHLSRHQLLPAEVLHTQAQQVAGGGSATDRPLSMVLTQHHFVLLFPTKLQLVNRTSKSVVQEVPLDQFAVPLRGVATMPLGLCRDHVAGRVYVLAGDDVLDVESSDEDRDMWRILLDKGDYRHAREGGDLAAGEESGAVDLLAGPQACRTFICGAEDRKLRRPRLLLQERLDTLGREDHTQATMVATWLTELLLDRINRALLQRGDEGGEQRYQVLAQQLRDLLSERVDVLDAGTTTSLLASYGRIDDLLHFARARKDYESVLEYLLQRGEAQQALSVLRKPSAGTELTYKFAPALMALAPAAAVQSWIDAVPPLDPARLLPALLQYGEPGADPQGTAEALKYVRYCLSQLGSTEPALHNLVVAMLAQQSEDEGPLLEYLASAGRDLLGRPQYDPVHALRLVRERGRLRAAVQLFCELGIIARKPEGDEVLSRKLWLTIARHLVEQQRDTPGKQQDECIRDITHLLEESKGAIRIEDILPLFPDFVEIDAFKDAICSSLEVYNQEIEDLRREMQVSTKTAQAIREDLAQLEHRAASLDTSEPCARCGRPLHQPPPTSAGPSGGALPRVFLFPTGNAFHGACLCAEVGALLPPHERRRLAQLAARLAGTRQGLHAPSAGDDAASTDALLRELDALVTGEDPLCGEQLARQLDMAFVMVEEGTAEAGSWEL